MWDEGRVGCWNFLKCMELINQNFEEKKTSTTLSIPKAKEVQDYLLNKRISCQDKANDCVRGKKVRPPDCWKYKSYSHCTKSSDNLSLPSQPGDLLKGATLEGQRSNTKGYLKFILNWYPKEKQSFFSKVQRVFHL